MEKIKRLDWFGIYWASVIVILPLYHAIYPFNMPSRDYKDGFYYLSCAVSLFLFQKKTVQGEHFTALKILSFCFVSLLYINWKFVTDNVAFFHIFGICLTLAIMFQFAHYWKNSKKLICLGFSIALISQFSWVTANWLDIQPSNLWGAMRKALQCIDPLCPIPVTGSLENPMLTASYLSPILSFATVRLGLFAFVPFLISLFLLKSAIAWFSFFAVISYVVFLYIERYRKIKISWLGFVFPVVVAIITPFLSHYWSFLSDSTRYKAWSSIILNVGFSAYGKGAGWFFYKGREIVDPILRFYQEHNEFLALYVAGGFLGVYIVLCFFYILLKNYKMDFNATASLLATLCTSYGAFPLHISSSALTFAIACGALMSYINIDNRAKI